MYPAQPQPSTLKEIRLHGTKSFPCAVYRTRSGRKGTLVKHHWQREGESMSNIKKSVAELIGQTPLLEISNFEKNHGITGVKLLVKPEYLNPLYPPRSPDP